MNILNDRLPTADVDFNNFKLNEAEAQRTESAIYYCKTARQLLCALLLADLNRQVKHNYLFINTFLKNISPDIEEFICKKHKKFEKVVVYNTNDITSNDTIDPDIFLQDIMKYYDSLLAENHIDISQISNFHVFSALRFSLYLVTKQKCFNLYEDSNGSASIAGLTQWIEQREKVAKRPLALKYGLIYGESEYVNKIFIHDNGQINSQIPREKIVEFNVQDLIRVSDENYLKEIYMFYNNMSMDNEVNLTYDYVILSQYYDLNIKLPTASFWGAIADCFIPDGGTFVIKPHPADKTDFSSTFNKYEIVNKNVPYELFESLSKIKNIICVTTSAICNSENSAIRLGKPYISFELFTVYSILYLISKQITGKTKICYYGNHLENFTQLVTNKFNDHIILSSSDDTSNCDIAFYDDFQASTSANVGTAICFYNKNRENDLFFNNRQDVIIHMRTSLQTEDFAEERYICIRSNNEKLLKRFSQISETVFLNHSKISIKLESVTNEIIMKIKMLETQKGIVELQEKLNKLEQKLDSVNIAVKFDDK